MADEFSVFLFMADGVKRVLVADDSEDDVALLRRALREAKQLQIAHHSLSGIDAIAYLRGDGEYSDREQFSFPDLLLLDLQMPLCDGFQVLRWLARNSFPALQVVMWSSSNAHRDMRQALALGADYYQIKPATLDGLRRLSVLLERSCALWQESLPRSLLSILPAAV